MKSRCDGAETRVMRARWQQDRVLIRCADKEPKTSGAIIIPDAAAEKLAEGEVIERAERHPHAADASGS